MTRLEIIKFEAHELVAFDQFLLIDNLLKKYCHFIISLQNELNEQDEQLQQTNAAIHQDPALAPENSHTKTGHSSSLQSVKKCLIDVLYAILFLGVWCTHKTIDFHLKELLQSEPNSDLISSFVTQLDCLSLRSHKLLDNLKQVDNFNILTKCSTTQLTTILHYIKEILITDSTNILIFVRGEIIAKVLYEWLREISSKQEDYSLVRPDLIVDNKEMAEDSKSINVNNKCNTFVICSSSKDEASQKRLEELSLKCDLIITFDFSLNHDVESIIDRAKYLKDSGKHLIFSSNEIDGNSEEHVKILLRAKHDSERPNKPVTIKNVAPSEVSSDSSSLHLHESLQSSAKSSSPIFYKTRMAKCFSGRPVKGQNQCFFYKISMSLTKQIPRALNKKNRKVFNPEETRSNFALVSGQPLPKICSFPIFTAAGEMKVSVEPLCTFMIKEEQVNHLRIFHEFLFSKVLGYNKPELFRFDPDTSKFKVLLAPVVRIKPTDSSPAGKTIVDWHLVERIVALKEKVLHAKPTELQRKDFKFKLCNYLDTVLIPWYRPVNDDKTQYSFFVERIWKNLNPMCKFPHNKNQKFDTYCDYYKSKYDVDIIDKGQPLLESLQTLTRRRLDVLLPNFVDNKGQKHMFPTIKSTPKCDDARGHFMIPELCNIHPMSASLWRLALTLPCILYRLNSLFLAEQLRNEVAKVIGLKERPKDHDWPALEFTWLRVDDPNDSNLSSSTTEETLESDENLHLDEIHARDAKIDTINLELNSRANEPPPGEELRTQTIMRTNTYLNKKLEELFSIKIDSESKEANNKLADWCSIFLEMIGGHNPNVVATSSASVHPVSVGSVQVNSDDNVGAVDSKSDKLIGVDLVRLDSGANPPNDHPEPRGVILGRDDAAGREEARHGMLQLDPMRSELDSIGPDPCTILNALTLAGAGDAINLERLETLGDSFLKFSSSVYLFCMNPSMQEGQLTSAKCVEISNRNLFRLGIGKRLPDFMFARKFDPLENWLPPNYSLISQQQQQQPRPVLTDGNHNVVGRVKIGQGAGEQQPPPSQLSHQAIHSKSIADCVEALIGAYLISSGTRAALLFMRWMGLNVMPPAFNLTRDIQCPADKKSNQNERWHWLDLPPPASSTTDKDLRPSDAQDRIYNTQRLSELESSMGYTFKNKVYLIQALIHNSSRLRTVFGDQQRLEFLGDSVLDYLITRYLYADPKCHEPGYLTDLRSALVNNKFFAKLAVGLGLHRYLVHESEPCATSISAFLSKFNSVDTKELADEVLFADERDDDLDFPAILSDLFEAVAGAIFLDSNLSLDQVWRVYYPLLGKKFEQWSRSDFPKSSIRRLYERMPMQVSFSRDEPMPGGTFRSTVEVFGHGEFSGVGKSKRIAQSTAARKALERLNLIETKGSKVSNKK